MRKAPTRPNNDITQQYNSGVLTVCALTDAAQPGYKPILKLTPKAALRYEERRLGIARLYQSRQAQVEIERVVRGAARARHIPPGCGNHRGWQAVPY